MFRSLLRTGSLVLDLDGNRLDAKFLRDTGAIDDHFTILKGVPPEPLRLARFQMSTNSFWARWKSTAGKTYRIQKSESIIAGPWIDVSTNVIATGATTSWNCPVPPATGPCSCFYRVVEVP